MSKLHKLSLEVMERFRKVEEHEDANAFDEEENGSDRIQPYSFEPSWWVYIYIIVAFF